MQICKFALMINKKIRLSYQTNAQYKISHTSFSKEVIPLVIWSILTAIISSSRFLQFKPSLHALKQKLHFPLCHIKKCDTTTGLQSAGCTFTCLAIHCLEAWNWGKYKSLFFSRKDVYFFVNNLVRAGSRNFIWTRDLLLHGLN